MDKKKWYYNRCARCNLFNFQVFTLGIIQTISGISTNSWISKILDLQIFWDFKNSVANIANVENVDNVDNVDNVANGQY